MRTTNKLTLISIIFIALSLLSASACSAETADYRAYAHGISYLENPQTHKSYLIWSDACKKGIADDGSWTHDVYSMKVNMKKPKVKAVKRLIKAPEAQEPASSSCTGDGNMIVTFEDGNDAGDYNLYQRYAIYDSKMKKLVKYPADIAAGGHSGHAASTSKHHIVFWCEGWIDGDGYENQGTGDDLYVTSMESDGSNPKTTEVAKSENTRDWWPLPAASGNKSLLLWQRYVDGEEYAHLCYSLYNPSTGNLETITENETIVELTDYKLKYYCYHPVYLDGLNIYVVNLSTIDNKGVLLFIDEKGNLIKEVKDCADFVREAAPAVRTDTNYTLYYPVGNSEIQSFEISPDYSVKSSVYDADYEWSECGTAGFLDAKGKVYFASLDSTHFKKGKKSLKLVQLKTESQN